MSASAVVAGCERVPLGVGRRRLGYRVGGNRLRLGRFWVRLQQCRAGPWLQSESPAAESLNGTP